MPRNRAGVDWILLVANASFHSQTLRGLTLMEQDKVHLIWFWHVQVNDCCGNDSSHFRRSGVGSGHFLSGSDSCSLLRTSGQEQHSLILTEPWTDLFCLKILEGKSSQGCACPVLGLLPSDHGVLVSHNDCRAGLEQEELGCYSVRNRCNTTRLFVTHGDLCYSRNGPVFLLPSLP